MKRLPAFCVALLVSTLAIAGGAPQTVSEPYNADVGYKTVAQALASLRQDKDASFSVVRGWTIVTDEAHLTVWSFAPKTDPSFPAVVKRMVTSTGTGSKVTMSVLCEAKKAACAGLVREFSNHGTGAPGGNH
jgi:hypothetical protein